MNSLLEKIQLNIVKMPKVSEDANPTLKGKDSVGIRRVMDAEVISTQRGMPPPKPAELSNIPQVILHGPIVLESIPIKQAFPEVPRVVAPVFVLQKLLSHEEHGNAC